ncbi:UNVERIFIED_CONTAM: protein DETOXIFICATION 32 [Sesamum calycinum]|uniref:Protein DETOXIFICATION 32 n=1 Tax=Sesamum calycinum TaxID=2727403 RepID=A0AAW2PSE7_9LAMI
MGSAVETLCGQAYGAGQLEMLGVYLQRSWVILRDLMSANISLHFRITVPATDRADGEHIAGRGKVSTMDDSSAFRLRPKFSDGQVLAGAEQNHGHGLDLRGGVGVAYSVQLAADAETWVGDGGRRGDAGRVMVVHSGGSADLYIKRDVREGLDRIHIAGVPESVGFC